MLYGIIRFRDTIFSLLLAYRMRERPYDKGPKQSKTVIDQKEVPA